MMTSNEVISVGSLWSHNRCIHIKANSRGGISDRWLHERQSEEIAIDVCKADSNLCFQTYLQEIENCSLTEAFQSKPGH